jgi:hypothetical protein
MYAMRIGRRWPLFLLVYLVFDFAHPWVPGVFSFEADQLFIDGVLTLGKIMPPRPALATEPQPSLQIEDPGQAVRQSSSIQSETIRRFTALTERRYLSGSRDRSSPPSASPDVH